MAKGPLITPEVEEIIAEVFLEHKDWRAKEIQAEVNKQLREDFPHIPDNWPRLSTVQQKLAVCRKKYMAIEDGPRDKPWHLGTLNDYPLSSKTIAMIFELKIKGLKYLSVRDAQWFDRLSSLPLPIGIICMLAQGVSEDEIICDMLGRKDFDTSTWEETELLGILTGEFTVEGEK